jgi:hypothetical protein
LANTANATYTTAGPAFTNQQLAFGGRDAVEMAYHGTFNFTGDNATATVTVNWIDGTQTPFFTQANPPTAVAPALVICGQLNTAATTAVFVQNVNSITSTGAVLTLSGNAPAVAIKIPFIIFPYTT